MGREFVLEPIDGMFGADSLAEAIAFIESLPSFRRSDGAYVIVSSYELRDEIVRGGTQDDLRYGVDIVAPESSGIVFNVSGDELVAGRLATFMKRFVARWPAKLVGLEGDGVISIDHFARIFNAKAYTAN